MYTFGVCRLFADSRSRLPAMSSGCKESGAAPEQHVQLRGSSDPLLQVQRRFRKACERLIKSLHDAPDLQNDTHNLPGINRKAHHATNEFPHSLSDAQFVRSLVGKARSMVHTYTSYRLFAATDSYDVADLAMKAPTDCMPASCRSQGNHVPLGNLQIARFEGLHPRMEPQCQPNSPQRDISSDCQRMEQLTLHSRLLLQSRPAQRCRLHSNRYSFRRQSKTKITPRKSQKQVPRASSRSWVTMSNPQGTDMNMMSQAIAGASWASPEATLKALSNATEALNSPAQESAILLDRSVFSTHDNKKQQAPASPLDPQTKVDLKYSMQQPAAPTDPKREEVPSTGEGQDVLETREGGQNALNTSTSHDPLHEAQEHALCPQEDSTGPLFQQNSFAWDGELPLEDSCAVCTDEGAWEPQPHLNEAQLQETERLGCAGDATTPRILPGLDLCAEHSLNAHGNVNASSHVKSQPARQQLWTMQVHS